MDLAFPWLLLGFLPVAAVAVWALFRPARRMLAVASVSLWEAALASMDRSAARRSRRVTLAWWLLLAGAAMTVLAAAGPVFDRSEPGRHLALGLHGSGELAGDGGEELRLAAGRLVARLNPSDRVQLLHPPVLGGATQWLSPAEARDLISAMPVLPVPVDELGMQAASGRAQRAYHFAVVGSGIEPGPAASLVELPGRLPPAVIEDFGAETLPDGQTRALVGVLNASSSPWRGRLVVRGVGERAGDRMTAGVGPVAPGERVERMLDAPGSSALVAELTDVDGRAVSHPAAKAYLTRSDPAPRRVLLSGRDEPVLRQFVAAHPGLEPVADPRRADLVIANLPDSPPSADKPALVLDPAPAAGPDGWRRGDSMERVSLAEADVSAGEPARAADFGGVVVRRLRPWIPAEPATRREQAVVRLDGGAVVLAQAEAGTRRVYMAFDLSERNTNAAGFPEFIVFLGRVVDSLSPAAAGGFASVSSAEAGPRPEWRPVERSPAAGPAGPLPWPGVYADESGRTHAVTLRGLAPAGAVAADVARQVDELPLPEPQPIGRPLRPWPVLAGLAAALWLAGWALRLR